MTYGVDGWPWVMEPGLEVISNDGRNFLVSGARSYDVIVSEPSNPWITGVSNLFTVDHYEAATRSLAPGGIYCQWVQLYEMSLGNIKTLFRTFAEVFPYVVVFAAETAENATCRHKPHLVHRLENLTTELVPLRVVDDGSLRYTLADVAVV